jgi:hypothetical protein
MMRAIWRLKTASVFTVFFVAGASAQSGLDACAVLETSQRTNVLLDCIKQQNFQLRTLDRQIEKLESLLYRLEDGIRFTPGIPSEAVVAFGSAKACPEGWRNYTQAAGRTIVGVGRGNTDERGNFLTARELFDAGGFEAVGLKQAEMPRHNHSLSTSHQSGRSIHDGLGGSSADFGLDADFDNPTGKTDASWGQMPNMISESGQGQPHDNMPPFLVLRFCIKD